MRSPQASENPAPRTIRRGFLAAAWAAVAGAVLKHTTQPVKAGTDGDVVLGGGNIELTPTVIANTGGTNGLLVTATAGASGYAIQGTSNWVGVWGHQERNSGGVLGGGVMGTSHTLEPQGAGVIGIHHRGGVGMRGVADESGIGVLGWSQSGIPIVGQMAPWGQNCPVAIYGINTGFGYGVYGLSASRDGVVGATGRAGSAGVVGTNNNVIGAYGAVFFGPVIVRGDLTVVDGAKSAAVRHPDGSSRRLFCVESPESWFEDFGKGQLQSGTADVPIDPTFAAVSAMDNYHVFLTGYEDFELRVSKQTPTGFRVEAKDTTSSGRFSWRIAAKRKDVTAGRFETVTIPAEPVQPPIPTFGDERTTT